MTRAALMSVHVHMSVYTVYIKIASTVTAVSHPSCGGGSECNKRNQLMPTPQFDSALSTYLYP